MKNIILVVVTLFMTATTIAQRNAPTNTDTRVIIRDGSDGYFSEKPLVVIDGKIGGDLQSLSPDKIVKVEVLKGNAATTLHGEDGKKGVIIVTTKTGGQLDTVTPGTKKIERIVTINKFRTSNGSKDTTIVQTDSMFVKVDGDNITVNGMPFDTHEERIVRGVEIPGMDRIDMGRKMFYLGSGKGKMNFEMKAAPKIGLSVQDTEEGKGVQVLSVVASGAAAKAGIQANDRIVSIDQTPVNDVDGLKEAIAQSSNKRSVMVHVLRGKKEMHMELVYPRELKKADL